MNSNKPIHILIKPHKYIEQPSIPCPTTLATSSSLGDHTDGAPGDLADKAEPSTAPESSVSRLKFSESVEQTGTLGDIELDQGLVDMEAMQQEIIAVFNEIDRDKSGSLSMDELHRSESQ
jgi:hypothetical protein